MIIDWLTSIFTGNNGSSTRVLFADSYLAAELMKVPLTSLRSRALKQVLGVICEELVFNFGKLYVKHHRGFNEMGFAHYGVVLDMEQISKRDLIPMYRQPLNLRSQGVHKDAEQWLEQTTIEVRNPAAHAIIQGN